MELGEKLKQARLEAGLSQRQLCGDTITRNMLSQIENGSAKPSLATLQVLSARLGKPVSYFWEDAPSENLSLLKQASDTDPETALSLLQSYLSPDPLLDDWYYSLLAQCQMALAEQALDSARPGYARSLLVQAEENGKKTRNFDKLYRRGLTLLQHRAGVADAAALAEVLPDNTEEMLLRARAALETGNPDKCLAFLTAADRQTPEGLLLQGDAMMEKKMYEAAASSFLSLESSLPRQIYPRLEICYRELGDYQKAYEYACKQR